MKGIPPQDMAISQCLTRGSDLTCTTCWGDEVSGTVVVVGDGAPVAVLRSAGSEENCYSIHIVNLAYVKDMQLGECVDTVEDPPPQDVSQVVQRYKAAVKEARRKGVNVSAKEQHIFDQLHKMYNKTVWQEQSIFIPECDVTVSPPYRAEDCTGTAGSGLDRVQKILRQQEEADRTNQAS